MGIIVKMVGNYMTAPLSLPLQPAYHMAEMQIQILILWHLPAYNMTDLQIQILILWYLPADNMTEIPIEIPVYNMAEMQIQILLDALASLEPSQVGGSLSC